MHAHKICAISCVIYFTIKKQSGALEGKSPQGFSSA